MRCVGPTSFLTLHYRLTAPGDADFVSTFKDTPATLSLGTGELAPALEARLVGLAEGARASFDIPAGEIFGEHNPQMMQRVRRNLLQELEGADMVYNLGDLVQLPMPNGPGVYSGVVRELGAGWLLLDFNHPLAGIPLKFDVHVIGIL